MVSIMAFISVFIRDTYNIFFDLLFNSPLSVAGKLCRAADLGRASHYISLIGDFVRLAG